MAGGLSSGRKRKIRAGTAKILHDGHRHGGAVQTGRGDPGGRSVLSGCADIISSTLFIKCQGKRFWPLPITRWAGLDNKQPPFVEVTEGGIFMVDKLEVDYLDPLSVITQNPS